MRAYSICCAALRPITSGISSRWLSVAAAGALGQHLFEQDPLVRHVLVDDPQSVASGGDDEAVVDLAQRAQVG